MNKPLLFSIIVPAKSNTQLSEINSCLASLNNQTYKYFDVTIITDKQTAKSLKILTKKYPFLKLLTGDYTKPQARNLGASQSSGDYLIHIDVDYILAPQTLEKCYKAITKQHAKAVVIHETITDKTIWQKARKLERQINKDDKALSAPQCIERKLFKDINGFDETVGDLDDWGLYLRLQPRKERTIYLPPLATVYEPTNLFEILQHRYRKGRYLPLIQEKYSLFSQTSFKDRLYWYKKKLQTFAL